MRLQLLISILISCVFIQSACAKEPEIIISDTYYLKIDDQIDYSKPEMDRSQWQSEHFNGIPLTARNIWVQIDFNIDTVAKQPLGLLVSILGSFDAYWDGEFIASNGVVGRDRHSEIPGLIDKIILLPRHLTEVGTHTLSLRISAHHNPTTLLHGSFWSLVSEYESLVQLPYKQASRPMVMSGALLLIALYSFFVYCKSAKQPSYAIFSLLCLSILALTFAESWRGLWPYTYDWQIPRLIVVLGMSWFISLLLSLFFAWFFQFKSIERIVWISITLVCQLIILLWFDGYDSRSLYVFLIGVLTSSGICLHAFLQKQENALLMLGGMLLFIAPISINTYSYMDQYFFVSFAALISLMLYTLAKTMHSKQQQLIQSQINASRLELELVKRNLQPHFILNTLTAIEEWIEDSPKTAVKFIQALADEFRFMAHMSAKPIIQINDEIALCQSHLKVMGYRTNIKFSMVCNILQQEASIPPGVVLTLLENALSHNLYQQGEVVFNLQQIIIAEQSMQQITFIAPITQKSSEKGINLGIGSQYIEARLTESFANNWEMKSLLSNNNWQVTLVFPLSNVLPNELVSLEVNH
ncbi:MAG: histidine kinase [Paraglaciecola sp.]|uniref:histidine kinase n=1 Tax=Paraglaciecola sp. TaxID=1920173 RepID=UPI00329A5029